MWTLERPVLTALEIEQSWEPQDIDWTKDDIVVYGDEVDIRGRALDQWGRAMFAGGNVPALYKIQASGMYMGMYYREVWDLESYSVQPNGWVYDTFSGMPPVDVSFTAWYDADNDDVIDAGEITSNELLCRFVSGGI